MSESSGSNSPTWCEACRDHFPEDHYDDNDSHKVGIEWGPTGWEMFVMRAVFSGDHDGKTVAELRSELETTYANRHG